MVFAATGHTPFTGDSISEVLDRVFAGPPDLSGVPTRLRPLLTRCLAKQPEERPTMSEVVEVVAPPVKVAILGAGAGTATAANASSDASGEEAGSSAVPEAGGGDEGVEASAGLAGEPGEVAESPVVSDELGVGDEAASGVGVENEAVTDIMMCVVTIQSSFHSLNIPPTFTHSRTTNCKHLRLGYVNRLADHQTAMQREQAHNRVHLEDRTGTPHTERNLRMRPAVPRPKRHCRGKSQRGGDGRALKVL